MVDDLGWVGLEVRPTFDGFTQRLNSGSSRAMLLAGQKTGHQFGDAAGDTAGRRFGTRFSSGVKAAFVAGTGAAVVGQQLISGWIDAASDAAETANKADVIFDGNAGKIEKWAGRADRALGLSKQQAQEAAASFGDMFGQIGFGDRNTLRMSKQVVQLAADLGSFNNLGTEDVLERIAAGFRGEYDSLQKVIPNISAARVAKEALTATGKKSADQLTAEEKAAATLAIIQRDGARANGDFARTSEGNANQQKILAAQYDNLSAKLGRKFLPLQVEVQKFLIRKALPALLDFSDWFEGTGGPAIDDFIKDAKPLIHDFLPQVKDLGDDVIGVFKDLAPVARDAFDAFDSLPDGVKKGILLGGGLLTAKALLTGGGGGGKGGVGAGVLNLGLTDKAQSKVGDLIVGRLFRRFERPIPVIVTNPGAFGGGLGGKGEGGKPSKAWLASLGVTSLVIGGGAAASHAANKDDNNSLLPAAFGFAGDGGMSLPSNFLDFSDTNEKIDETAQKFQNLTDKADTFRDTLFLTGKTKVEPRFGTPGLREARRELGEFIAEKVIAGQDVTPYIKVTGYDRAMQQIKTLSDAIHALPTMGVDNGVPYVSGAGTSSGRQAPASGAAPRSSTGGVNINIERVVAHDYDDFMRQSQRRADAAAMGGRAR